MLYAIAELGQSEDHITGYRIFDVATKSVFDLTFGDILKLFHNNVRIAGLTHRYNVVEYKWPNRLTMVSKEGEIRRAEFVYIGVIDGVEKSVHFNGMLTDVSERFQRFVAESKVANYTRARGRYGYNIIDAIEIRTEKQFKEMIDLQYRIYIEKSAMMGLDGSFKYTVIGKDVVLDWFKGESDKAVLPSFITGIGLAAFSDLAMESIKLNDGIKIIGNEAFRHNMLHDINITSSVQIVGRWAFYSCGIKTKSNLHIESSKTVII